MQRFKQYIEQLAMHQSESIEINMKIIHSENSFRSGFTRLELRSRRVRGTALLTDWLRAAELYGHNSAERSNLREAVAARD